VESYKELNGNASLMVESTLLHYIATVVRPTALAYMTLDLGLAVLRNFMDGYVLICLNYIHDFFLGHCA
jgi:hypothetical protein